ncbi:hypothetical protein ACHAXS_012899 [Conticribra weissflogii]
MTHERFLMTRMGCDVVDFDVINSSIMFLGVNDLSLSDERLSTNQVEFFSFQHLVRIHAFDLNEATKESNTHRHTEPRLALALSRIPIPYPTNPPIFSICSCPTKNPVYALKTCHKECQNKYGYPNSQTQQSDKHPTAAPPLTTASHGTSPTPACTMYTPPVTNAAPAVT